MMKIAELPDRCVVSVAGEDRVAFLQGLVSNDVAEVAPGRAVWAALLTPQGKYLADFFMLAAGEVLLLDCAEAQAALVVEKLSRFRLRSRVSVARSAPPWLVFAAWDGTPGDDTTAGNADVVGAPDPRVAQAGWRLLSRTGIETNSDAEAWDAHRLALGLPDGSRDMETDKTVLLEAGFDRLEGISWTKGCYMGQELTARTRYRGLIKRRLVPVEIEGVLPAPGTPILAEGREVGTLRSGRGRRALATLRLDALDAALRCEASVVRVVPDGF